MIFFMGCDSLIKDSPQGSKEPNRKDNTIDAELGIENRLLSDYFYDFNDEIFESKYKEYSIIPKGSVLPMILYLERDKDNDDQATNIFKNYHLLLFIDSFIDTAIETPVVFVIFVFVLNW